MKAENEIVELTERINEWTGEHPDPSLIASLIWTLARSTELREDFEQAVSNAVCDHHKEMAL